MEIAYKFRIYPNKAQQELIHKTFGCVRFVYNYYLNKRKEMYEQSRKTFNYRKCSMDLTQLKNEYQWLREVDKFALQNSLRDLENAYINFFKGIKKGIKVGYPQFKSKKMHRLTYRSNFCNNNLLVFENLVQLPKLGKVKCKVSRKVEGRILNATVSQEPSGKYFIAIHCTQVDISKLPETGQAVGIDMGIRTFATLSDGSCIENPKYLEKSLKKLKKLQRELSRKTNGSTRWEKQRIKIARLHEHIANQRQDMQQKASTDIIRNNDVICIEDLGIQDMMKNKYISRYIGDAGWGNFLKQLVYKAEWYGRSVIRVEDDYCSSQICSVCGFKNIKAKNFSHPKWKCPECGTVHDRDVNAATNILNEGLRKLE